MVQRSDPLSSFHVLDKSVRESRVDLLKSFSPEVAHTCSRRGSSIRQAYFWPSHHTNQDPQCQTSPPLHYAEMNHKPEILGEVFDEKSEGTAFIEDSADFWPEAPEQNYQS